MQTIKINTTRENGLGPQMASIRDILVQTNTLQNYQFDFSNFKFAPPSLSVLLSALVEQNPKFINIPNTGYLKTINFPVGIQPDLIQNWSSILDSFSNKSFIPLIHFPTSKRLDIAQLRNDVISKACQMIGVIVNLPPNYMNGINYIISEFTDNIIDHANTDRGWLSLQYYPQNLVLDICIADSGRGLLKAYQDYKGPRDFSSIKNHLDAINFAIKGQSTKQDSERGFGLHTSREMLIEGLNGKFIFCSGNGMMYNYDLFDFKATYNGTFLILRIPFTEPNRNFNVYKFVE